MQTNDIKVESGVLQYAKTSKKFGPTRSVQRKVSKESKSHRFNQLNIIFIETLLSAISFIKFYGAVKKVGHEDREQRNPKGKTIKIKL